MELNNNNNDGSRFNLKTPIIKDVVETGTDSTKLIVNKIQYEKVAKDKTIHIGIATTIIYFLNMMILLF